MKTGSGAELLARRPTFVPPVLEQATLDPFRPRRAAACFAPAPERATALGDMGGARRGTVWALLTEMDGGGGDGEDLKQACFTKRGGGVS